MIRALYVPPWRIDVVVRDGVHAPVAVAGLARSAADALSAAGAPSPASIGLVLTGDLELSSLNQKHMGHDGPTDVISFPLLPPSAYPPHVGQDQAVSPGAVTGEQASSVSFVLPPGRRPHIGDVVISVERAIDQATTGRGGHTGCEQWSAANELRLLVIHGVLHLCGWDHVRPAEGAAMRALERQLLEGTDGRA
ncbi:MAG: rRNA maturation RNase YbeY [Chloroflexi bacterium]|nr:rRNA maturation RNase YbeY [Chloroflexota bacterium]